MSTALEPSLSGPQVQMLSRAMRGRQLETFIGRGQARTAAVLERRGFGYTYYCNSYTRMFGITALGQQALASETESAGHRRGER